MALSRFLPVVAYDPDTQSLVESGMGYVYAIEDTEFSTPLDVYDAAGDAIDGNVLQVSNGLLQEFQVEDHDVVRFVSGDSKVPVWSPQSLMEAADTSASAATAAASSAASAAQDAVQGTMGAITEQSGLAVEQYMTAEGFSPLMVVQTIDDVVPGTRPGTAYLVIDAPTPMVAPEIIGTTVASSSSGTSLVVDVPSGVQDGDWLLCFMTTQDDGTSDPAWTSSDVDGWVMETTLNVDLRTTAVSYRLMSESDEGNQLTFNFSKADQRRLVMTVLLRDVADTFPFYVVGTPQGHNGVGTDDTTVPSVLSTTSKALHLVFGWSNGNVGSSHVPDAPTVGGGMSVVAGVVEPPTPSGGFTTVRLWARELETGGPSGSVTLDWPLLAQRAGLAIVVLGREDEEE